MARMLAAPGAHLGTVQNAVVVGVHLVEANAGPLSRPLLDPLQVLFPSDAAGSRGGGGAEVELSMAAVCGLV
jgi:hypothetical protein